jgi:hypothetical protein
LQQDHHDKKMGQPVSKAKTVVNENQDELEALIATLENKLESFLLEVQLKRGLLTSTNKDKEVTGGRTVSRVSNITVATSSGIDSDISEAIDNFFQAAENSIDGDDNKAKKSAVEGAKGLLTSGLNAIFGASSGQGKTKKSFVVLFLNNAFVRVDYYVYAFTVTGKKWGAEASKSGACYLADIAVLDTYSLQPQEIDYLLSQALRVEADELNILAELKFHLIQSVVLGRALKDKNLDFEKLPMLSENYANSQKKINEAFAQFKPANLN